MCSHVFLHNSRQGRLGGWEAGPQSHGHAHAGEGTWLPPQARAHALRSLLQTSHVLQEPRRRKGGENYDKLWHFHSSSKRYTRPQSVRRRCTHSSDQKPRFITEITLNMPGKPGAPSICCVCISRKMFALHFLISWHIIGFVRTHHSEVLWHKSIYMWLAAGMGTPGIWLQMFQPLARNGYTKARQKVKQKHLSRHLVDRTQ